MKDNKYGSKEHFMTKYEVLLCIYCYLDKQYLADKNKGEEYIYYISNLNPYVWVDEGTADPAYYADYLKICSSFFPNNECSVQEGLIYAKKYLEQYNIFEHEQFSYNIDEVIQVFSKCTLSEWTDIYTLIKSERNK